MCLSGQAWGFFRNLVEEISDSRLTYMSILVEIQDCCRIGQLIKFEASGNPRVNRNTNTRKLYISRGIESFLASNKPLVEQTRADFSDFVSGELVKVALHLDHKHCLIARLEPPADEVWEIRIYDTEPQLRFYGRFAECDTFVALTGPMEKSSIFRRKWNYSRIKRACTAEWRRLFRSPALCKGEDIDAYLSSNAYLE